MKRSKFSLSHYKLLTCDMGELIPASCVEVLPGDTFQGHTSALIRLSPLVAPVMHPVTVRIHQWFVPTRLLWTGWESFITGGKDGSGDGVGTPPFQLNYVVGEGTVLDYLGLPPGPIGQSFSMLPIRGYNMIFNECYRDEDLVAEVSEDSPGLQFAAWEKDYFTTARPWPQRGPEVTVPISGYSEVVRSPTSGTPAATDHVVYGSSFGRLSANPTTGGEPNIYLEANFDNAETAHVSVADIRDSLALQRYAEARARYGARYVEYLRYLGVNPSDSRLQRPEFLGGGKQVISFSEVLQTSDDGVNGEVGRMAGHGIAALRTGSYRKFFNEHGYVYTMLTVRPKAMYVDGRNKMWNKALREQYWQRELEHIGQQTLTSSELFSKDASPNTIFGYQDRYSEYRQHPSLVAGEFRSTLDYWHMARSFTAAPTLNSDFINCDPSKRNFAVQTNDTLLCMVYNKLIARRMVSAKTDSRAF